MGLLQDVRMTARTVIGLRRTLKWVDDIDPESENLVPDDIEATVDRHGANVVFRFEGQLITYDEFEARANTIAHWALSQGLKPGDCVALFMENRPDYVAVWFGLSKVGIVTALINAHLSDNALAHCVNIADAKAVILGAEQHEQLQSARPFLTGSPDVWTLGGPVADGVQDLEKTLATLPSTRPDRSHRAGIKASALCLYVYTSGTTGLPKAARLPHARTQGMMRSFVAACKATSRDRIYVTLPLYHGTGGLCGVGMALSVGASIILRRRFSASAFWDEAAKEGATLFAYIGELCRYLLNQPPHPMERAHRIRSGFGNGLRPEIWSAFHERFAIPYLAEFYGSTEGNVSFMNLDGKVGAVGRIPKLLRKRFDNVKIVKFDVETESPLRGPDGFCMLAEPNEAGEMIGRISSEVRERFEGYNDPGATRKKILRDVFETGDMWYRTGDLMKMDEGGWIYFVDRTGDTFRWKGENVATNEVGEVLSGYPGIEHANVYGVQVPGMDGRAGMAAITASETCDLAGLHAWMRERLPDYAVPVFLRLQREAETTGTFKYRKVDLVKDGFDPGEVNEPLYFAHPERGEYVPLTQDEYETILAGGYRL